MENASKALILAGSILIAIMVISLGILMFTRLKKPAEEMLDMTAEEKQAYNNQFTSYLGSNVSGSEVNALMQRVISADKSSRDDNKRTSITYNGSELITKNGDYATSTRRVETGGVFYEVTVTDNTDGIIRNINIKK